MNRSIFLIACGLMLALGGTAQAVHFRITLTIESPADQQTASADPVDTPESGTGTPTLEVNHGEPLVLQFLLTNVYPHGVRKGVTVHYYIVHQSGDNLTPEAPEIKDEADDSDESEDDPDVILNGRFIVNFKPQTRVGLRQQFRINQPGRYLVRVQSEHSQSDHEHFSQLALTVK